MWCVRVYVCTLKLIKGHITDLLSKYRILYGALMLLVATRIVMVARRWTAWANTCFIKIETSLTYNSAIEKFTYST